ncbi:histidinol-phosphatase [Maioricimonas sp. JC845]|uniref:histidinol-phosphatase n=1 Tax=Maioricimonas sp. JC845 TaxID=3232138 RepID=UPI003457C193
MTDTMENVSPPVRERLEFALTEARNASELILRYYHAADLNVELKADESPVTAADRGAEELLRKAIEKAFPDDGILGEELGETPGTSGFRWILDPVDGTKSFIHGVPLFGTLIGLEHEGQCVAGISRFPALDEVVYAARGGGAWWQKGTGAPTQVHVKQSAGIGESLFCYTAAELFDRIGARTVYDTLSKEAKVSRGWGDCYGHMLVATGRADLMVDPLLSIWDAAALIPIVTEAGGLFVDWTGNESQTGGNGISMTPGLKDAVLELTRPAVKDT